MKKTKVGYPIATAVTHMISAASMAAIGVLMTICAVGIILNPFLIMIGIVAAVLGVAAFWGFAIQLACAIGVTVTSAFEKNKLCALFCGVGLIADVPAFGVGLTCSINQISQIQPNAATISLFVITVAVTLLSLAGGILAVITLIKNIKYKRIP